VTARNVKKVKMTGPPPKDAFSFLLKTKRGQRVCWHLARQTADAFAKQDLVAADGEVANDRQFFKGSTVRVFFPIKEHGYYATKTFNNVGTITLIKILRCVESAAVAATVYHMQKDEQRKGAITMAEVSKRLNRCSVCKLLLRPVGGGNQVYVELVTSSRRDGRIA
jgi:hypothetical protein